MLLQKMQGNLVLCYRKTIDNEYATALWLWIIPPIVIPRDRIQLGEKTQHD